MNCGFLENYMLSKKGITKEYKAEWEAFRYMLLDKMVVMEGCDNTGREILTFKCEPAYGELLRNTYKDIVPGYYMNKVHWNSVYKDGDVPEEVVKDMADQSYKLILSGFSKKKQADIAAG